MIRRHISVAHICLRCQIRLGQRSLPFSARRAYSTELPKDHEENGLGTSNGQSQHNESQEGDRGTELPFNEKDEIKRPVGWPPEQQDDIPIRRQYLGRIPELNYGIKHLRGLKPKLYGRNGDQKVGDKVELSGVNALGKTAEVLVLRDSKFELPKKKEKEYIIEGQEPESIDILARIQSERGIVSLEDIRANINEFRPDQEKIQTWSDFNDLVQSLQNSFTIPQLRTYIKSYPAKERMKKVPPLGAGILYDENAISRSTPWVPEISPISQPIDHSAIRGYSASSYNDRQIFAVRILRECWRLEVPELLEGIGEVEVQVQIKDLDFLTTQGYMEALIKRYYLNEPEKIEIYRPRQVLRITSSREKSALIIGEIQDGIRSISRDEFDLKELCPPHLLRGWEARILTPEVLTKLGELTKTGIRRLPLQEPILSISSMTTDKKPNLSRRADVVRRLLLNLARFDKNNQHARKVGLRDFEEPSHKVDLPGGFVRFPGSRELSWHEKLRTWSRWTSATPKSTEDNHLPENDQYTFPFPTVGVKLSGKLQPDPDPQGAEFLWSHEYSPTTSIKAGTILHNITSHRIGKYIDDDTKPSRGQPTISSDTTLSMNSLKAEIDSGSLRIFSPQAPNLSGLFQSDHIEKGVSEQAVQEIVMQFKPNPWALCPNGEPLGPSAFDDLPPLEMSFSLNRESYEVKFRELHAIVSTEIADLMLPEFKADLQFERKIRSRMLFENSNPGHGLDELNSAAAAVTDFIKNSQLDLTSDQQLETPPKLVLPLPRHLCTEKSWNRMGGKPQLGVNVEYLFAKLEYRKTAPYNFENHEIRCTSVEAGKAGGSHLELSLRCRSMPSQDEFNHTMKAALQIVRLMDMRNITSVYGQMREVFAERKEPFLGPDDFKYVPKRPSDFLEVKRHYEEGEEKRSRFDKRPGEGDGNQWDILPDTARESRGFQGRG
ncbi:91f558a1-26b0-4797-8be9-77ac822c113d [Sclerotinia trifoliorum]|uniref:91f558a1-26b0-4797-8be9-77ac822c113d n=1 Tax=Sclerotinia trifoliorum TaxID=28548 RepID=A0A8H2VVS5_9HELO|nr:91f558a1-26b0-4797-8be9-77ac822c113d [Sclerotinia trifoliorum]